MLGGLLFLPLLLGRRAVPALLSQDGPEDGAAAEPVTRKLPNIQAPGDSVMRRG